ncbi:MAG TPA: class I SAM-dependent methyltransferase [Gaiellaceae bacterium]|nr:class I SAM-dependent methyltransferase [Gaiellaceae bacterium]
MTAVELGPRLAAIANRNVPQADVVTADFETWEPEQAGFDAVVAFTSFHWLDPETKYAKLDLIHARIEARPAKSVTKHHLATLTLGRRL